MYFASLRISPFICVFATRSDPARSTKLSLDVLTASAPTCIYMNKS